MDIPFDLSTYQYIFPCKAPSSENADTDEYPVPRSSFIILMEFINSFYDFLSPHFSHVSCITIWPNTHTTNPILKKHNTSKTIMKQNSVGKSYFISLYYLSTNKNAIKYHQDQITVEKKNIRLHPIKTLPILNTTLLDGNKYEKIKYRHPKLENKNIAVVYTIKGMSHVLTYELVT